MKFEFGDIDGELQVIDEILTPDSRRFWDVAGYKAAGPQPSHGRYRRGARRSPGGTSARRPRPPEKARRRGPASSFCGALALARRDQLRRRLRERLPALKHQRVARPSGGIAVRPTLRP